MIVLASDYPDLGVYWALHAAAVVPRAHYPVSGLQLLVLLGPACHPLPCCPLGRSGPSHCPCPAVLAVDLVRDAGGQVVGEAGHDPDAVYDLVALLVIASYPRSL